MEKLYYTDAYTESFSAEVTEMSDRGIVLDRTAFFPEGGGQSSDRGYISDLYIYDVQEIDGVIYHKTKDKAELKVGSTVNCRIDFKKRFSDMQNHSGEHIVSGIVHNVHGYNNVGFHLNENEIALDFDGVISEDALNDIEFKANEAVWANIEIKAYFPDENELGNKSYRSKKEIDGSLRLVEIKDIDVCACCAPHVSRTGEIGLIKIIGHEKHRGGTRIYILCGERALRDYCIKQKENKKVGNLLKVKEYETSQGVGALLKKKNDLEYKINEINNGNAEKCALQYAERDVIVAVSDFTGQALTYFANGLSEKASKLVAAFGKTGDNEYRYMLISKCGEIGELVKELNKTLRGRGGGKNGVAQGSVNCSEKEIYIFFDSFVY